MNEASRDVFRGVSVEWVSGAKPIARFYDDYGGLVCFFCLFFVCFLFVFCLFFFGFVFCFFFSYVLIKKKKKKK